jgi:hypothetical protein
MLRRSMPWIPWMFVLWAILACARTGGERRFDAQTATVTPGDVVPRALLQTTPPRVLGGETIATSRRLSPGATLAPAVRPEPRVFRETTLFLPAGASAGALSIPIDATDEATIHVLPGGKDPVLVRAARADLALHGPGALGIASSASPFGLVSAHFTDVDRPGNYVLSFGTTAGAGGLVVDVRLPRSTIALTLTASAAQMLIGDDAFVDVAVTDGAVVVDAVTIEARLVDPITHAPGAPLPIVRGDDGRTRVSLGEALARDAALGARVVEVRTTGTSGGRAFDRFGSVAMQVGAPIARMLAAAPRAFGAIEGAPLLVDVDVEVAAPDRFELTAVLVSDSHPRAVANTTATLSPGIHRMTLAFDSPVDAEWALRNLRLYSIGTSTVLHSLARGMDVHGGA